MKFYLHKVVLTVIGLVFLSSCATSTSGKVPSNHETLSNSTDVWLLNGRTKAEWDSFPLYTSSRAVLDYMEQHGLDRHVTWQLVTYWDEASQLDLVALYQGRPPAEIWFVFNQRTGVLTKLADLGL